MRVCWTNVTQSAEVACPAATGGGNGLCLLFHGPSGVGKTMMANACASHVKKKVYADHLLVRVHRHEQETAMLAASPGAKASTECFFCGCRCCSSISLALGTTRLARRSVLFSGKQKFMMRCGLHSEEQSMFTVQCCGIAKCGTSREMLISTRTIDTDCHPADYIL